MKDAFYLLTILFLTCCGQPTSEQTQGRLNPADNDTAQLRSESDLTHTINSQDLSDHTASDEASFTHEFTDVTMFKLSDTIVADFNGDGKSDQAIFKKENTTTGIIIKHGQTKEIIRLGFGKTFAHLTDFNWVDSWGLVKDRETYEVLIEDSEIIGGRKVQLENASIVVRKEEVGGGVITYRHGKYEWVHQAD